MLHENFGNTALRRAIRVALTGGTLAATYGVAHAQSAAPPAAAPADNSASAPVAEVVVTGSRISVPNQVSISPVTFVSAADIQQTGATRIEDMLNMLPQVFASQGSNIVNGADETATVDLRGLNAKRTLVLVNGLRLGPGDPRTAGAADVNMIPTELIESVEVLTGGASSVYGADAVAGVVNFKLNDHFEGVKLVADGGIYQHHNTDNQGVLSTLTDFDASTGATFQPAPSNVWAGSTKALAFIAGLNSADGNGNATFYATYRNNNAVIQSKYGVSACTMGSGFLAGSSSTGGKFVCAGSGTTNPARFFQLGPAGRLNDNTLNAAGQLTPFGAANEFNFGPLNYYMRPDDRYTAGSFMHYDFNEHASVYANTMFMDDRSIAQIAPSGAFQTVFNVPCTNPLLTTQEVSTWCGANSALTGAAPGTTNLFIGRRSVEGGDRLDDVEHTDWRVVLGIKGKINDSWDYDASYQYSIVNLSETFDNDISKTKIADALNVVNVGGVPTCAALAPGAPPPNGAATGCVPWNIFNIGGVNAAQTNYLNTPGLQRGQIKQTIVNLNFTGDLGKYGVQLPTASNGLKVNLGGEWHGQRSFTAPDFEFQSGDLAGQGGPILPVNGGITSREGFIEANLPIIEDKPFFQSLALDGGYRFASYSLDGGSPGFNTNTFKIGLEWTPVQDYRFRASFSRASRAPNAGELFTADSVALDGNTDPCAGTKPTASQQACVNAGVPANRYGTVFQNSAKQYNGLEGGNPQLRPETALTSSFGVGWTPSYVPNLRVQVDYYDIKIEQVIQTIGADTILQECVQSDLFCDLIHRDANLSLWLSNNGYVTDALANVGELEEKGVDIDMSYAYDLGAMGRLHASYVATWLNNYTITPIEANSGTARNCAGFYGDQCSAFVSGAGSPVFRWRNTLRLTWSTPWQGLDVSAAWRYFSPVLLESLSSNPNLAAAPGLTIANGGISNTDARIPSFSYFDMTASYNVSDKIQFRVGCNNVLDKQAPAIGTTNQPGTVANGNTFPQVYDALGRFIFGTLTVQF
ncbi:MAG TPA: TonB-dependent receptor [Steroidobacteraceae bacterium]|jgi:outer membrane receptor protein involved in Fe transport